MSEAPVLFEGASVILPDRVERVSVRVEGGFITGLDVARDGGRVVDLRGRFLAPALVDVHGDAFERQMMPRPGVMLPLDAAFLETDRQLGANGIGTAYHALTLSWEPGLRSVETGWQVLRALERLYPRLTVENRLQLRWETFCAEAMPLVEAALGSPLLPSIAFNDHTSIAVLHPDVPLQEKPFEFGPDFPAADFGSPALATKMEERAKRSKMTPAAYVDLLTSVWERRPQVPGWVETVAAQGRAAGAAMLSHDDTQEETRAWYRSRGSRLSEFPMNRRVAAFARAGADGIILGAPNAARGGSHLGSVGAADMIREGLCDVLASDYYYPAMLAAIARLQADGAGTLATLWPLVSGNAASAMGLADRGRIATGLRADLVVLDWPEGEAPAVRQTWVRGNPVYSSDRLV